jgi:ribosomal protein S18 acetylase RimI-like enzyme
VKVTDLPGRWSRSPYLLGEHARADVLASWADDDAVLVLLDGPGRDRGLFGLGAAAAVAALTERAVVDGDPALGGIRYATLARGAYEAMDPDLAACLGVVPEGSAWDWMWTPGPLTGDPTRAERLPLGAGTAAEVAECLSRAHPTASTAPDDERLIGWWGVRQDGRLMAVIGAILFTTGLPPHLVSLGVDPVTRGQGLAGVVMSAAVRDCLQVVPDLGPPMVSLGLYASNDVARRVYTRLGFRLEHEFASRHRAA